MSSLDTGLSRGSLSVRLVRCHPTLFESLLHSSLFPESLETVNSHNSGPSRRSVQTYPVHSSRWSSVLFVQKVFLFIRPFQVTSGLQSDLTESSPSLPVERVLGGTTSTSGDVTLVLEYVPFRHLSVPPVCEYTPRQSLRYKTLRELRLDTKQIFICSP